MIKASEEKKPFQRQLSWKFVNLLQQKMKMRNMQPDLLQARAIVLVNFTRGRSDKCSSVRVSSAMNISKQMYPTKPAAVLIKDLWYS